MTSAYPKTVDELLPAARKLAAELGQTPSRNKLKSRFRIGADKANALLAALAEPDTDPVSLPDRPLHLVRAEPTKTPAEASSDPGTEPAVTGPAEVVVDQHGQPLGEVTEPTTPPTVHPVDLVLSGTLPDPTTPGPVIDPTVQVGTGVDPGTPTPAAPSRSGKPVRRWPLVLLAAGAFVAIWSGWVGLGQMCGFGVVHPLPGIADDFTLNSAITLPIGVEAYAAFAMRAWLAGIGSAKAKAFAMASSIGSLVLGAAGQVAYHVMTAAGLHTAPPLITTFVSCLPVLVLGSGAALVHLLHESSEQR